jgi:hypothetical protein
MKISLFTVVVFLFTACAVNHTPKPETISLFDGKTFNGWEGDTVNTWRIENGALVGGSLTDSVKNNEFLATVQTFKNFDLTLQFKLTGTSGFVNAGVQVRSQRMTNPAYEMTGYQADLGHFFWGALYDESRRNKFLARADADLVNKLVRNGDWNDYRVRCTGRRIEIWLNGTQTVDYTEEDESIVQSGLIALQIHGGGKAEVAYKDIRLVRLPD